MPYSEQAVGRTHAHQSASCIGRSPFSPGRGKLPPYLAGREAEQTVIRQFLDVVADRDAPDSDIVLYGPRGNGKTALLLWSQLDAKARGIDVLRFSGPVVPSLESLVRRTSATPRWLRWLDGSSLPRVGGVKLNGPESRQLRAVLARRARKRPTLVEVDEAHMLGTAVGRVLLNEVQELQGEGLPLLLMLAGTPDLPRHLGTMGASFSVRNKRLRIGRLEPEPAADAIRLPLAEHGRSIRDDALEQVVAECHGYPFFLQIWGKLLWELCSNPPVPASRADVDRARRRFVWERDDFYYQLLEELKEAALVSVAARVAAEFARSERVLEERITLAISSSLEAKGDASDQAAVEEAGRRLRHLGYIWPVMHRGSTCYEPGIPSLMRFVARHETERVEYRRKNL